MRAQVAQQEHQFKAISVIEIALKSVGASSFDELIKVASVCKALHHSVVNVCYDLR